MLAELVLDAKATLGEGAIWHGREQRLYWVDITAGQLHVLAPADGSDRVFHVGQMVGAVVPRARGGVMLWIALWDGGGVSRWDPRTGARPDTVDVPSRRVTSCAFGGPELDDLYITTARIGLTEAEPVRQPGAGGLFRARPGVAGVSAFEFAG